jgi:hypothetical protein
LRNWVELEPACPLRHITIALEAVVPPGPVPGASLTMSISAPPPRAIASVDPDVCGRFKLQRHASGTRPSAARTGRCGGNPRERSWGGV